MNSTNTENTLPVVKSTRVSNIVNGTTFVKFEDLKDFITVERGGPLSRMAVLVGTSRPNFTAILKGYGKNPSALVLMHRLEKHYGIKILDDPYR